MTEIAQLFESALRHNRASLLRKAAMNTVASMPAETTLRDLLRSDAGAAIRELTLQDLTEALEQGGFGPAKRVPNRSAPNRSGGRAASKTGRDGAAEAVAAESAPQSREEKIYRKILAAMSGEPLTIGQLSKRLDVEVDELRGYLTWMKKMGKVVSTGRARATRYQVSR